MHDIKELLDENAVNALANRGFTLNQVELVTLDKNRKTLIRDLDKLRQEKNSLAKERNLDKRSHAQAVKAAIQKKEKDLRIVQEELDNILLTTPNFVSTKAPKGLNEEDFVVVKTFGTPEKNVKSPDHTEIGENLKILDFKTATKMSGARFSILRGKGAKLERALTTYFLNKNTEAGYEELSVPTLVSQQALLNTGQLPKFEDELFRIRGNNGLYLIPTGEVPLVNSIAGTKLVSEQLPYAVTGQTQCFRAEAGAHGKDTRGLIRQHEFSKVEIVRVVEPETAGAALEGMLTHVEGILQELELTYRVIALPQGDLGFSSMFTYDIEVWFPKQGKYREISSISNFGQFQARRANIKVPKKGGGWTYAATLNGSALPLGRTIAALIEQKFDNGKVVLPEALHTYCGFSEIVR